MSVVGTHYLIFVVQKYTANAMYNLARYITVSTTEDIYYPILILSLHLFVSWKRSL